jgi:hypothetical protein
VASDFTIADVLAWARTKPADETYDYVSNFHCALAQFLKATGRSVYPMVGPYDWDDYADETMRPPLGTYPLSDALNSAVSDEGSFPKDCTFGGLVKRLEALCPETVTTPSEWTKLDAYLADIEQVSA